jgi:hypothetical protein
MQGFVPERSFTKDRRVINMRIDSVLMVCAGRISQPRRHSRQPHPDDEGDRAAAQSYKQPEAAQVT